MGNKRLGAALAVIIGVMLAAVGLWAWAGGTPTQAGSDGPLSSTASTPTDPVAQRTVGGSAYQGDGPPNHADNRGHPQPRELTPEARALLETKAVEVQTALDRLRAPELPRAAAVEETLVSLGYPADSVFVEDVAAASDQRAVVFGISTSGGCVKGSMLRTQTRVEVDGLIPEWGCRTPKTR
ncbi:hypothetical protein [Actinokineospora xionganensis]|uniref:Secreted protein n=1 Tax=Actinokineospora xionganensis TaxID=2684470 RepID=A0ABR7L5X2_9PSEU|nr:hypothetical protein [Actinokineospora xionganensis]MBC6447786.1 hypothetical protein [Actinokineospora xionganensis]